MILFHLWQATLEVIGVSENRQNKTDPKQALEKIRARLVMNAKNDPLGSYTGVPEDPFEEPVQDADDL